MFQALSELPTGAPLTLRDGPRIKRGLLVGVRGARSNTDKPRLGIQVENDKGGGLTQWIPLHDIWRVARGDGDGPALPKRQKGRRIQETSSFTEDVLLPLDPLRFTEPGGLRCLIVGSSRSIEADATQPGLATRSSGKENRAAKGTLNDLLRLKDAPDVGGAWRTRVVSAQSKPTSNVQIPNAVIFDGAAGYLKWRGRFREASALIVLDRTDPHYKEAAEQIRSDYVRRAPDSASLTLPPPPPGLEVLHFNEAVS